MSRTLFPAFAVVLAAGMICGALETGLAQQRGEQPARRQPGGGAPRPGAGVAAQPGPGPQNAAPQLSPELEQILKDWSKESAGINELQGEHGRIVYDHVFQVSKYSKGHFYFKGPDKGRIDLNPEPVKAGAPDPRKADSTGRPYTLQRDQQERWICDGQKIWRIDDTKKEAEVFPIPEEARGQNIMDGPLPFLFGLPPEKAKLRFEFTLVEQTPDKVWLHVRPLQQQDAQNWSEAEVMLMKDKNYLPSAVKLKDPAGNEETVYVFEKDKLKIGPQRGLLPLPWGPKDPFNPDVPKAYEVKQHRLQQAAPGERPAGLPLMVPSLVGLHGTLAKNLLLQLECQAKFVAGDVAPNEKLIHTVYRQQPDANTPLQKGQTVELTYYVPPEPPQQQPPQAEVEVPDLRGLHWQRAQAALKDAGYDVSLIKWVKGQAAPRAELTNIVATQRPAPGTKIAPDEIVHVTVYLESRTAANSP